MVDLERGVLHALWLGNLSLNELFYDIGERCNLPFGEEKLRDPPPPLENSWILSRSVHFYYSLSDIIKSDVLCIIEWLILGTPLSWLVHLTMQGTRSLI